jgi:phosphoglycerol transferase MdoB-like AlkP superfamily enzyme
MFFKTRYRSLCILWLLVVFFSTLTRTVLLFKSLPNLGVTPLLLAKIYGAGFFFDCVTFSYLAIPFVLAAILVPDRVFNSRWFNSLSQVMLFIVSYLLLFDVVAECVFFSEFSTRFNFIAVDYLIYTTEVINNIRESYPLPSILAALFVVNVFVFFALRKHFIPAFAARSSFRQRFGSGFSLLVLPVLSLLLVNVSLSEISNNNYADELAGNGVYNLFAAFRNNELNYDKFYFCKDNKVVVARLRQLVQEKGNHLASPDGNSIDRVIHHEGPEKRLNVVVVVEESLSAEYLKAFGNGYNLTPNLDKLAGESLFFTHLYAAGTRTVRGLEAITLSIPPLPGTSIIKRPKNENFFSWGSVMKERGYDNKFIYGGHGYFDNMNYFFENNGFGIVDRTNFAKNEVTFENAWGACDEDLFNKVVKEADKSAAAGKPFFHVIMTTSNHRPFTFPNGKIDIPSKEGREGGVKYSDYAIGRLIAEAKKRPWFNDTIFVIVADHCASSAGKTAIPVKRYEIPLFIYAPAHIAPRQVDRMMSQIDIAPTVLGLLNASYTTKFMGKDILNGDQGEGRAFISTYQKLGFIEGNKLLVLGPKKEASFYTFNRQDGKTTETAPDERLLLDGLGYYQGTDYVYHNRLNRLSK